MFMNISMYNHWNKIILLDTELQAEPQWKSTISAAMQYQIQRIATDKDGIAQIQNASLCMCEDRCDSPGYQDRGEHFKHLLHLHKRWRSLRQGTFFFCRTRMNCNGLQHPWWFCHESLFVAFCQKNRDNVTLALSFTKNCFVISKSFVLIT